jgi:hypothetical protein
MYLRNQPPTGVTQLHCCLPIFLETQFCSNTGCVLTLQTLLAPRIRIGQTQ